MFVRPDQGGSQYTQVLSASYSFFGVGMQDGAEDWASGGVIILPPGYTPGDIYKFNTLFDLKLII